MALKLARFLSKTTSKAKSYGGSTKTSFFKSSSLNLSDKISDKFIDAAVDKFFDAAGDLVTDTTEDMADFDAAIRRMGTRAQLTETQINQLRQHIKTVISDNRLGIKTAQFISGLDRLQQLTDDSDFVNQNIGNLGLTMQGLGLLDPNLAAQLLNQIYRQGITQSNQVEQLLDKLFNQFAKGALSAADIAQISPALFSVSQAKGPQAIIRLGALAQVLDQGNGVASDALTGVKDLYTELGDQHNLEWLRKHGIDVFKQGSRTFKQPTALLNQILATNTAPKLENQLAGTQKMKHLATVLQAKNRAYYHTLIDDNYKVGYTRRAAQINAQSDKSAVNILDNQKLFLADDFLADPLDKLTIWIQSAGEHTASRHALAGKIRPHTGHPSANPRLTINQGKNIGATTVHNSKSVPPGVQPVYVVNMPGADNTTDNTTRGFQSIADNIWQFAKGTPIGFAADIGFNTFPVFHWSHKADRLKGLENYPDYIKDAIVAPGVLDAWDDVKSLFTRTTRGGHHSAINPENLSGYLTGHYPLPQPVPNYPAFKGQIDVHVKTFHDGRNPEITTRTTGLPGQTMED
jgi:hypothetical protein